METAKFHGRSKMSFLGGAGIMLLASVAAVFLIGNALALWNPNWGGQNLVAAMWGLASGPVIGLAGLTWFASRRHDGSLFLGGLIIFLLWYPLIFFFLQLGPYFGGGL